MNDLKNISLAWFSSSTTLFSAIVGRDLLSVVSALVLPVVLFAIGKAIDVALQIYLRSRSTRDK